VAEDSLTCIVEIPKGSRNKYEYDEDLGGIKLDRLLFSSVVYPTDYGYFPDTLAADGDPLDVLVCLSEPTFPGCIIPVKPIGLFRMEDEKGQDDKVVCVPLQDPAWNKLEKVDDLDEALRNEIAHFFEIYKDLEKKKTEVHGWYGVKEAEEAIEDARRRYEENGGE
jgi:inorganic pyrophosphatase